MHAKRERAAKIRFSVVFPLFAIAFPIFHSPLPFPPPLSLSLSLFVTRPFTRASDPAPTRTTARSIFRSSSFSFSSSSSSFVSTLRADLENCFFISARTRIRHGPPGIRDIRDNRRVSSTRSDADPADLSPRSATASFRRPGSEHYRHHQPYLRFLGDSRDGARARLPKERARARVMMPRHRAYSADTHFAIAYSPQKGSSPHLSPLLARSSPPFALALARRPAPCTLAPSRSLSHGSVIVHVN